MKKLRIFGALTAVVLGVTMFPVTATAAKVGDTLRVGNGNGDQHREPNVDGYSYETWLDGRMGGSGSMTLGSGATFNTEWSATGNQGNFLARRGKTYGSTKKATDYGTIVMDYAAQYNAQGGNSRLCVYGWFDDPMVEYYIIEDWKRSVFIPVPKKGNAKECSNYCTIVLISHASKVMLKILQARL